MPDLSGGPILFLNPEVVLDRFGPSVVNGVSVQGVRNAPPHPNAGTDLLGALCREVGAALVLTRLENLGDVRRRLELIGLRVAYENDWFTDPALPDPADSIPAWLAAHGSPTHAIVDRPGAGPAAAIRIDVGVCATIGAADIRATARALSEIAS